MRGLYLDKCSEILRENTRCEEIVIVNEIHLDKALEIFRENRRCEEIVTLREIHLDKVSERKCILGSKCNF